MQTSTPVVLKRSITFLAAAVLACCLAITALAASPSEAQAVTKPAKPTISKVSPYSTTKLTVTVKKVSGAAGYQVKYWRYGYPKAAKSVTSTKLSKTITGLKVGKKYCVKVRAYKKSGTKKIYGSWSKVKYGTTYQYSITYKLNGGTWGATIPRWGYSKTSATFTLKKPKRAGYDFLGWYTSTGKEVKSITKGSTGSKTLTARWANQASDFRINYIGVLDELSGYGANLVYIGTNKTCILPPTIKNPDDGQVYPVVYLSCWGSEITTLDVSYCPTARIVDCEYGGLTKFTATGANELTKLILTSNSLTSLDVSGCSSLKYLYCDDNAKLTSLKYPSTLTELNCTNDVNLESLDLRNCSELNSLRCQNTGLSALHVTDCIGLKYLDCSKNNLTELILRDCSKLENLYCSNNRLTELKLCDCPELTIANCNDNSLSTLLVEDLPKLKQLHCLGNTPLTILDLYGCGSGLYLYCDEGLDPENQPSNITIRHSEN